jgi:hypothetical protein
MDIIKGSHDHASAVADFWNARAQDPNSWWYGSPQKTAVPVLVPSASETAKSPHFPADLACVVAAWDQLPDAIKAAILTLVQAAEERDA